MNEIKIIYKSGNGESWIDSVKELKDGNFVDKPEADFEDLEDEFSHIIFRHDHDRIEGYGSFIIRNGKIVEDKYQQSAD